jgi:hypothetical protein
MISSAAQLANLASTVNSGNGYPGTYFKLANDIDLSGYPSWSPIGKDPAHPFRGIFDGDFKEIHGLKIDDPTLEYAGLFGVMNGTAKNIVLVDVDIKAQLRVGALAGSVGGSGTASISKCSVNGGTVKGDMVVGGLIGVLKDSFATNCYATCDVTVASGGQVVGGLVGHVLVWEGSASNDCILRDSYCTGKVTGASQVGGVAGLIFGGIVRGCYTTSELVVHADQAGGIAGYIAPGVNSSRSSGVISDCVALNSKVTGSVSPLHWNRITGKMSEAIYSGNYGLILGEINHNIFPAGTPSPSGDGGIDGTDISSADISTGRLTSVLLAGNGWLHNHPTAMPTLGFGNENSAVPPHLSPPLVLAVSPSGTGCAVSGTLAITFSKVMNNANIGTVTLTDSTVGTGDITLRPPQVWSADKTVFYVSYGGLSYNTDYVVKIDGFEDNVSNPVQDNSHTFKTVAASPGGSGGSGGGTTRPGTSTTEGSLGGGSAGANRISIRTATVTTASRALYYTGRAQHPAVKVILDGRTLTHGKDYSVTYKSNTLIGTAMVTIHGEGRYVDGASANFDIVPSKMGILRLTPAKGKLKVTWKKVPAAQKVTNYQVRYRVAGTSKWYVKTVKPSLTSVTLKKKRMKGKRIQVMVRSFKTIKNIRYYSAWSPVKTSRQNLTGR